MSSKHFTVKLENGSEVKLYVQAPTADISKMADRVRAKTWNECISDGILTKDEIDKLLTEKKIWGNEQEIKKLEIIGKIQELEKKLYLGQSKSPKRKIPIEKGKEIVFEIKSLRNQLQSLIFKKMQMEQNSAESLSDDVRFDFLVAHCTFYENGENVYKDLEDYNKKSNEEIAFTAASKLAEILYDYDIDSEKNLPENVWLKKLNLVDEDFNFINNKKEKVDSKGRKIDENGYYINNEGQRVDSEGNLLDEDGNYILQVEYSSSKPARKKQTTQVAESKTG